MCVPTESQTIGMGGVEANGSSDFKDGHSDDDATSIATTVDLEGTPLEQTVARSMSLKVLKAATVLYCLMSIVFTFIVLGLTANDGGVGLGVTISIVLITPPISIIVRLLGLRAVYDNDPTGILQIFRWAPDTAMGWKNLSLTTLFVVVTTFPMWGARLNPDNRIEGDPTTTNYAAYLVMKYHMVFGMACILILNALGTAVDLVDKTAKWGPVKWLLRVMVPLIVVGGFTWLTYDIGFNSNVALTIRVN